MGAGLHAGSRRRQLTPDPLIMKTLPPEILALKLPDGYEWDVFCNDPRARYEKSEYRSGWVNYLKGSTIIGVPDIRLPDGEHIEYREATVLEMCQALTTYLWMNHEEYRKME